MKTLTSENWFRRRQYEIINDLTMFVNEMKWKLTENHHILMPWIVPTGPSSLYEIYNLQATNENQWPCALLKEMRKKKFFALLKTTAARFCTIVHISIFQLHLNSFIHSNRAYKTIDFMKLSFLVWSKIKTQIISELFKESSQKCNFFLIDVNFHCLNGYGWEG